VSKIKEAGVFSMNKNMNNGVAQKLGFSAATVLQRDSCR
jgi:predicted transcriptional regulator YheO